MLHDWIMQELSISQQLWERQRVLDASDQQGGRCSI